MNSINTTKRRARKTFAGIFFGLAGITGFPGIVLSGCESPANPSPPQTTEPDIEGVVYESLATDEGLYGQVKHWLEAVAGSWSTFIPDEALPMMLPEMVGRLAEAHLEELDDVLDMEG